MMIMMVCRLNPNGHLIITIWYFVRQSPAPRMICWDFVQVRIIIMMIAIYDHHDDDVHLGPIVHEDDIPNIEKGVSAQNPNKRL